MASFDLQALLLGFLIGLPISVLFFWGLSAGMRWALASEQPGMRLFISFAMRSLLLLLVAYALTLWLQPFWALVGFVLAFFLVRVLSVRLVQKVGVTHATDS